MGWNSAIPQPQATTASVPTGVIKTRVGPLASRAQHQQSSEGVARTRIGPSRRRGRRQDQPSTDEPDVDKDDSANLLAAANVLRMSRSQDAQVRAGRSLPRQRLAGSRGAAQEIQEERVTRTQVGPSRSSSRGRGAAEWSQGAEPERTRIGPRRNVLHGREVAAQEAVTRTRIGPSRDRRGAGAVQMARPSRGEGLNRTRIGPATSVQVSRPSRGEGVSRTRIGPSHASAGGSQSRNDTNRVPHVRGSANFIAQDMQAAESVTRTRIGPAGRGRSAAGRSVRTERHRDPNPNAMRARIGPARHRDVGSSRNRRIGSAAHQEG